MKSHIKGPAWIRKNKIILLRTVPKRSPFVYGNYTSNVENEQDITFLERMNNNVWIISSKKCSLITVLLLHSARHT
jgi:hypothetical protein